MYKPFIGDYRCIGNDKNEEKVNREINVNSD